MHSIQRIKTDLNSRERRMGMRKECVVNTKALREVINDYDRMDSRLRAMHLSEAPCTALPQLLYAVLLAMYMRDKKSSDDIMRSVVAHLSDIIKEDDKYQESRKYDR